LKNRKRHGKTQGAQSPLFYFSEILEFKNFIEKIFQQFLF